MVVRTIGGFLLSVAMMVPLAADSVHSARTDGAQKAQKPLNGGLQSDRAHKPAAHGLNGLASVYGHAGEPTASGEKARPDGLTAAHRTLPLNTLVRVKNRKTGREVTVRINDRGPFVKGRVIDLTPKAAAQIGLSGLAPVDLIVLN